MGPSKPSVWALKRLEPAGLVGNAKQGWEMGLLLPFLLSPSLWFHGNSELENKWIRQQWALYLWNQRQRSGVIHSNSCTQSSSLTKTSSLVCHPTRTETSASAKHAHSHSVTTSTGQKNKTVSPKKGKKCLSKGKETTKLLFWYNQVDGFSQLNKQSTRCL